MRYETPEEQRQDIKNAIAYYEERGLDWLDVVSYLAAVYAGYWPPAKRERKPSGRPRKASTQ